MFHGTRDEFVPNEQMFELMHKRISSLKQLGGLDYSEVIISGYAWEKISAFLKTLKKINQ